MTKREGTPAPAGLTDGEVERLAEIGRAAWCEAESARPSRPKWIAFARAVATAVVGVGAEPHGWCERCKAHTAAAVAVSWICRQCGCEAYEVPQRQPPTPAPGGQEGEGFQRVAEAVADYDQTPDEARAELEADGVDVDAFVERVRTRATQDHDHCQQTSRELAEFAAGYKRAVTDCGSPACPHRPPPARPPDGGDREPAAPTTNPSTISSKLVDGDTTPAGGDGCVDPCDDPRCTVHPPADVAPRPQAARGGEGEDEVRHLDEHNQELLKASDRLHWEIADLRAALSAARTEERAVVLGVIDTYRAGVKAAQLEALDIGHAEQVERLGQRILAVTDIRAALTAHWPAGGGEG
jgi:hypothetical protein